MKIKIIEKSKNELICRFVVSDCSYTIANAVRRAMVSFVPVMAIEYVNIYQNSSAVYDEMLAHRVGLIPLKTDSDYPLSKDCKCKGKGCSKCTVTFTLEKKGPGIVYSGDLKSSDPKVIPAFPNIPITELTEKQEVKFEAKAIMGLGKEHIKWSPCWAVYQYYPKIDIKNDKCIEAEKICPRDVFEVKNGKLTIANKENCNLCLACVEECRDDAVKVEGDENKFIFTVESFGQLQINEIVKQACKFITEELDSTAEQIKN